MKKISDNMGLGILRLETAINETGEYEDVRLSKYFARDILDTLKEYRALLQNQEGGSK